MTTPASQRFLYVHHICQTLRRSPAISGYVRYRLGRPTVLLYALAQAPSLHRQFYKAAAQNLAGMYTKKAAVFHDRPSLYFQYSLIATLLDFISYPASPINIPELERLYAAITGERVTLTKLQALSGYRKET